MLQAVGIVLLFDDATEQLIVDRNGSLDTDSQPIDLGRGAIPHMTLAQVLLNESQLESMKQRIQGLDISAIEIPSDGVHIMTSDVGNHYTWWNVIVTDALQDVHISVMDHLIQLDAYTSIPQAEYYLCSDKVSQGAMDWLQYFHQRHAYKNYDPHITIGRGRTESPELPIHISPRAIAIGRLGANGTVREIMYERSI